MNPKVDKHLPSSGDAIRGWTLRTYEANKRDIIKDISSALSKIHITVDLWTSGNRKLILGVVRHYILETRELKHQVLAVRELQGEHSSENQASIVAKVLCDFEIEINLGFFVRDNAYSNDTLCVSLSECMLPLQFILKNLY